MHASLYALTIEICEDALDLEHGDDAQIAEVALLARMTGQLHHA